LNKRGGRPPGPLDKFALSLFIASMTLSELNSTFESMFSMLTLFVQGGKTLLSTVPTEANIH